MRARSVPTMERTPWSFSCREEFHHGRRFEGSSVDEIDHDVGADQRLREAFTRNRVDTCIGRRRGTSGRWRSNATVFDPMRPVPPITTIRMLLLLPSLGSEDEKTATVT